jgi:hypothetical protein
MMMIGGFAHEPLGFPLELESSAHGKEAFQPVSKPDDRLSKLSNGLAVAILKATANSATPQH